VQNSSCYTFFFRYSQFYTHYLKIKLFLVSFVILSCLAGCNNGKTAGKKTGALQPYEVLTLIPQSVVTYTDFPATVQGKDIVDIRPMVDGYLEKLYVPEGANVTRGQLLFKLRNPQYEQDVVTAQAAIKIAIANVNAAQMNVDKVRPLVEKDIVSKYELEAAQYTLQSNQASLAQARASLSNAKTNLGYTELRSPLDGVIGGVNYKIGALVSSTNANPLTTLSYIDTVFAYFAISEKQLLSLSSRIPGNTLQEKLAKMPPVTLVLANDSVYSLKGTVRTASGLISTQTGSASLKAKFSNPQHILRSGSSALIRIPRTIDTALLVPQGATYELQNKRFIYKLVTGNKVVSTAITGIPTNDGLFFIVHTGLQKGDKVLISGTNLKDSTVIIPHPVRADSLYGPSLTH
jgi:membrane fusion protein (multidrug efflux system)